MDSVLASASASTPIGTTGNGVTGQGTSGTGAKGGALSAPAPEIANRFVANAWPVAPPRVFPPTTPCYREEVVEPVYETAQWTLMYEFHVGSSVCLFPDQIVLYDIESDVFYPNGQRDQRLASVVFGARNAVRRHSATEQDAYSEVTVTFCPDLPQPSACQVYYHFLGLAFNPAFVFPISSFIRTL